ncbi:MAG: hypothetical protein Q7R46_00685 [bacterium]|nr:hypothetical protein [bacterium]
MKITEKTTLAEILKIKDAEKTLAKHNVPCLGCAMASMEMDKLRVGDICLAYGIDCDKLIKDLNS